MDQLVLMYIACLPHRLRGGIKGGEPSTEVISLESEIRKKINILKILTSAFWFLIFKMPPPSPPRRRWGKPRGSTIIQARLGFQASGFCLLISVFCFLIPDSAYAADPGTTVDWLMPDAASGTVTSTKNSFTQTCTDYDGLTNKAVRCISRVMISATYNFLGSTIMKDYYKTFIYTIFSIYVIIYGLQVVLGQIPARRLKGEFPIIAIKIGVVLYMINDMQYYFTAAVGLTGFVLDEVTRVLTSSLQFSQACYAPPKPTSATAIDTVLCLDLKVTNTLSFSNADSNVWKYLDCMLSSLFSFSPDGADKINPGANIGIGMALPLGLSIFGVIVATSLSGLLGVALLNIGIASVILLLMAIFKAAFQFITCMVGLAMMFAIGAFAMPCMLFNATRRYFDRWLSVVIKLILEPVFILMLLVVALWMLDWAIFWGEKSFMRALLQPLPGECVSAKMINELNISGTFKEDLAVLSETFARAGTSAHSPIAQTQVKDFLNKYKLQNPALLNNGKAYGPGGMLRRNEVYYQSVVLPGLNIKSHPNLKKNYADCIADDACAKELQNFYVTGLLSAMATLGVIAYLSMSLLSAADGLASELAGEIGGGGHTISMPAPMQGVSDRMQGNLAGLAENKQLIGGLSAQEAKQYMKQEVPEAIIGATNDGSFFGTAINKFASKYVAPQLGTRRGP